jgi:hypothetical protein
MIYLKIAHTNDNDADYFVFDNLKAALVYIEHNKESEWVMSDMPFEEMPLEDYTRISGVVVRY